MKKTLVWLVCALLALAMPLSALAVVQPNDLFYVYDGANVLTDDTEATIVLNNDALYEACGAQIVIATIDSAGSMQLGDYAYTMFEEWGIGSAEKNNGVLILMEIGAEDYWYMQGSGIERNLSTGDLAELVEKYLEPDFARANYDSGAEKLFEKLFERVAGIYGANVRYREYDADDLYEEDDDYAYETGVARAPQRRSGGFFSTLFRLILIILLINLIGGVLLTVSYLVRGIARPVGVSRVWLFRPWRIFRPRYRAPRPPRPPRPPMGGFSGPRPGSSRPASFSRPRSGGFGSSSRSSGGGRSSFGGSRSFGGGRSGGGRVGGGGGSRGGGGGRGR